MCGAVSPASGGGRRLASLARVDHHLAWSAHRVIEAEFLKCDSRLSALIQHLQHAQSRMKLELLHGDLGRLFQPQRQNRKI